MDAGEEVHTTAASAVAPASARASPRTRSLRSRARRSRRRFQPGPPLNNRELFRRDRHVRLLRRRVQLFPPDPDHITPLSRGGRDTWMNVVTSCRQCNGHKRNRLPQECGLELMYAPYVPNKAEYLILTNRRILADQMEFLKQHVASHSRLVLAPA